MHAKTKVTGPPTRAGRLTERGALALPLPVTGYTLHWCPVTRGFGVRVTSAGVRAWISERRVGGKTVRRTLGKVDGRSAISADAARKLMLDVSSELQRGIDRMGEARAERAEQRAEKHAEALTLARALKRYVRDKRRGKDGLPLKERTRNDYLAMIEPGRVSSTGKRFKDGDLYSLAERPLARITAADMRAAYRAAGGQRQATYAMQVLRAVLNWYGVQVPGNPLSKTTAGKDRIVLPGTRGNPNPIPPERLPAWWAAATAIANRDGEGTRGRLAADYYRFMLLTGARGGEVKDLSVADVDVPGARLVLRDTKNRTDHIVALSRQALAIVVRHIEDKEPAAVVFNISDARKTLHSINRSADVKISAHDLRDTFASVAEELVSAYVLKRMMNHADTGDVTGTHYIGKSEAQLRAGWQAVADFIAGSA